MVPLPTSQRLARKHDLYWALSRIMTKGIDQEACTCNTRGITSCSVIARQLPTRAVAQHQCLLISAELWHRKKKKRKEKEKKKQAGKPNWIGSGWTSCSMNAWQMIISSILSIKIYFRFSSIQIWKRTEIVGKRKCVYVCMTVCARARVCVCVHVCVWESVRVCAVS